MKKLFLLIGLLSAGVIAHGQPFSIDKSFAIRCADPHDYDDIFHGVFEDDDNTCLIYGWYGLRKCSGHLSGQSNSMRVNEEGYNVSYVDGSLMDGIENIEKKGNTYYVRGDYYYMRKDYYGNIFEDDYIYNQRLDFGMMFTSFAGGVFLDDESVITGTRYLYPSWAPADSQTTIFRILPSGRRDWDFFHKVDAKIATVKKFGEYIYIAGDFTKYDGHAQNQFGRIDLNGNLDTTYKSPFKANSYFIDPFYQDDEGRMLVVGTFNIDDVHTVGVIRLMTDGSVDPSFHVVNIAPSATVWTICPVEGDDGYLIGGDFTYYDGYKRSCIAKIDKDGHIDPNYFEGAGIEAYWGGCGSPPYVLNIVPAKNDTYFVCGSFEKYFGEEVKPVVKIKGLSHVSIDEPERALQQMVVAPNPVSDGKIRISFSEQITSGVEITMVNILGKVVCQETVGQHGGTISVANLPAGVYLLSAKNEKNIFKTKKLIVQ